MNRIHSRTGIQSDRRSSAIVRKSSGQLGVSPDLVSSVCPKNSSPPPSSPIKKSGSDTPQNSGPVRSASKLWSGPWLIIQYTVGLPVWGRIKTNIKNRIKTHRQWNMYADPYQATSRRLKK